MEPAEKISPLPKAFLIALLLIVFSVITSILKQDTNRTLGIIPMVVVLGGIAWICMEYAKQMGGNVSFGNVFSHGFKGTALIAGIMGLWVALHVTVLFPESVERAIEMQRVQMEEMGMSDTDIDRNLSMGRKLAAPMGAIVSALLYLALGAIGALIGATFAKKNPNPNPF